MTFVDNLKVCNISTGRSSFISILSNAKNKYDKTNQKLIVIVIF